MCTCSLGCESRKWLAERVFDLCARVRCVACRALHLLPSQLCVQDAHESAVTGEGCGFWRTREEIVIVVHVAQQFNSM